MLKNLTQTQILAIIIGVMTGLTGFATQLTTLFGATATSLILAADSILTMIVSTIILVTTGQASTILTVKGFAGVENVDINDKAPQSVARLALDPTVDKVRPARGSTDAVEAIAKSDA